MMPSPAVAAGVVLISQKEHMTTRKLLPFFQSAPDVKFELDKNFVARFGEPAWGPLGKVTFERTYARERADGSRESFVDTIERVVNGTYQVQQQHAHNLGIPFDLDKAQRSAQKMFQLMHSFKFLPPGRGLWTMGTDIVRTIGAASLLNCFARDTEIITEQGVKQIGDLAGTTQRVLSRNGKWIEAPIRSFGTQQLWKLTLTRQGVDKVIYTTRDHRWFAKDRRKPYRDGGNAEFQTHQLRPGVHHLQYSFGKGIKDIPLSPFGIAHGFTFGDGAVKRDPRNSNTAILCGAKDKALEKYFALCPRRDYENQVVFSAVPNAFKELPSINENTSYLAGWLAGYFAADGSCAKDGSVVIASVSRANIEFVRDVCARIGVGYYAIREETRVSNLTNRDHTMYTLALMRGTLPSEFFLLDKHRENFLAGDPEGTKKRYWTVKAVEETDRVEEVYCATVPGEAAFTLDGNILTGNCAFVSSNEIDSDFTRPFTFVMDFSMLGVGCGFDTEGAGKRKIVRPNRSGKAFVIPDEREGWVEALRRVLASYVGDGLLPNFDYSAIRPYGAPIRGFGGQASGPDPLRELLEVDVPNILNKCIGRSIDSTAIVDLMCVIGKCVVAGNVRRTALIAFGQPDDVQYRQLKDPTLFGAELRSHRWASNNSVFADDVADYSPFAQQLATNGEPGFVWLNNAHSFGRYGDGRTDDYRVRGTNPCAEQVLESNELCNLVETFPSRHESAAEFHETLKFAYLYAKTVTLIPLHDSRSNAIQLRNRRIGTSMTGIVAAIKKFGRQKFLDEFCSAGYDEVRAYDRQYSEWMCVPQSIRVTTVKPSGTVSLLPGVPPGIHYPIAEYYIRRIRVASNSPLADLYRAAGYKVEPDVYSKSSVVIEFPVREADFDRSEEDVSMWEQLENTADMQRYWSDNAVSVTIKFKPDEAKDIARAVAIFAPRLKTVSFLPYSGHGYEQAPYEPISKEQYEAMCANIVSVMEAAPHETDDKYCDGDKCTIPMKA